MKIRILVLLGTFSICFFINSCASTDPKINKKTAGTYSVYGNWCGPDHPKYSSNPPDPIDKLDAACMKHDICYTQKGNLSCECDKTLNEELKQNIKASTYTRQQANYAKNIHRYFSASPCDGKPEAKVAPTRILQNAYQKTKKGISSFFNKIIPGSDEEEKNIEKE